MNIDNFLLTNFLNGLIAVVLLLIAYKAIDWITPDRGKKNVFAKGVSGGSVIIAAVMLGMSFVIATAAF